MTTEDDEAAAFYADPANQQVTDAPPVRRAPRAQRPTTHVPVRFDAATIAQVRSFSDDDGMTVSSWIRRTVEREMSRRVGASNVTVASGTGTFRRTS